MTTLIIDQYGPLLNKNRDRISLENFNLFYGKNESGKTLLIEALIKLLLKKHKDLKNIDRVEEKPEGYVIIETDEKESYKFPEDGDLSKIIPGLNTIDCCNIFIIRDSNLSIIKENEFYTKITDHLIGLRTADLVKLEKNLAELGNLTPTGLFSKELGNRIKNADSCIEKIDALLSEIKQNKFDTLEKEHIICKKNLEGIEKEIKNLDYARRREEYETGNKELNELETNFAHFKDLELFNDEEEKNWARCETIITSHNFDISEKYQKLQNDKKEFEKLEANYNAMEFDFRYLEKRKKEIDESIKKELLNYDERNQKIKVITEKSRFFNPIIFISIIILAISLIGIIINPSLIPYCSFTISLVVLIICFISRARIIGEKAWLVRTLDLIKLNASKFGLDAESIAQIRSNIQEFDEEFDKKKEVLEKTRTEKTRFETRIAEIENLLREKEEKIRHARQEIDEIRRKSNSESYQNYTVNLRLKNNYKANLEKNQTILNDHFKEIDTPLEKKLKIWSEKINALEIYKDKAKEIKFDERISSEKENEKQELILKLDETKERMNETQRKIQDIENTIKEVLLEEDELTCDTSIDLELIKDKLQDFITETKNKRENILKIKDLFKEIENEEKEKISALFSDKSSVSQYFKEITDGLYEEIIFDVNSAQIQVKHKNGKVLDVMKLSGGTSDQLYFSIRLALGEKLLEGKTGFFILDDPFIKADFERLKKMIAMLKTIVQHGWQILYFSTKFEISLLLNDDIKNGTIKPFDLNQYFSLNSQ